MPDKREHRGQHPADEKLFSKEALSGLRQAVADYSLLLTKGYAETSALKLVGDRFVREPIALILLLGALATLLVPVVAALRRHRSRRSVAA